MKNVITIILSAVLIGSVSLLFVAKKANNSLDKDIKISRSNADSLAKMTASLDRDVKKFKSQSDSLITTSKELEKAKGVTKAILASRERELWVTKKLKDENNKKYNDLLSEKKDWEMQLENLKTANAQLGQENKNLTNKAALLADNNMQLSDKLNAARFTSKDNVLIETRTKSGRLNIKGKKVRKIVASLNTQNEMKNPFV